MLQPFIPFLRGIIPSCAGPSFLTIPRKQHRDPSTALGIHASFRSNLSYQSYACRTGDDASDPQRNNVSAPNDGPTEMLNQQMVRGRRPILNDLRMWFWTQSSRAKKKKQEKWKTIFFNKSSKQKTKEH